MDMHFFFPARGVASVQITLTVQSSCSEVVRMYFILQIANPKSWLYLGLDKKELTVLSLGDILYKEVLRRKFATISCNRWTIFPPTWALHSRQQISKVHPQYPLLQELFHNFFSVSNSNALLNVWFEVNNRLFFLCCIFLSLSRNPVVTTLLLSCLHHLAKALSLLVAPWTFPTLSCRVMQGEEEMKTILMIFPGQSWRGRWHR